MAKAKDDTEIENGGFKKDPNELWEVFDLNAKQAERRHNATPEHEYALHAYRGTKMPKHHAAVFLKDPSFKVLNAAGVAMISLPQVEADAAQARKLSLEPGETVAKFEELTDSALLARVASRPGGEVVAINGAREEMIEFLATAERTAELPRHLRARDTSMPEADLGEDELTPQQAQAIMRSSGSKAASDPYAVGG